MKETLISPSGTKEIIISKADEKNEIIIEDFDLCDRNLDLSVRVTADNAEVEINGKAFCDQNTKKKWKISLFLEGKNQSGKLFLKGISENNSFLEFDGGGIITKNSQGANIEVDEKILLLSSGAKGRAIPVLRVETEDVESASHSAAIAPLNEEIFFFSASRGISPDSIKQVIKQSFLSLSEE